MQTECKAAILKVSNLMLIMRLFTSLSKIEPPLTLLIIINSLPLLNVEFAPCGLDQTLNVSPLFFSTCASASLMKMSSSKQPSMRRIQTRCVCSQLAGTKTARCTGSSWTRTTMCASTWRSRTTSTVHRGSASSSKPTRPKL